MGGPRAKPVEIRSKAFEPVKPIFDFSVSPRELRGVRSGIFDKFEKVDVDAKIFDQDNPFQANPLFTASVDKISGMFESAITTPLLADGDGNFQRVSSGDLEVNYFAKGAMASFRQGKGSNYFLITPDGREVPCNVAVFKAYIEYSTRPDPEATKVVNPYSVGEPTRVMNPGLTLALADYINPNKGWFDATRTDVDIPMEFGDTWFGQQQLAPLIRLTAGRGSDDPGDITRTDAGDIAVLAAKMGPDFLNGILPQFRPLQSAALLFPNGEPLTLADKSDVLKTSQLLIRDTNEFTPASWFMELGRGLKDTDNPYIFGISKAVTQTFKDMFYLRGDILKMEARLNDFQSPPSNAEKKELNAKLDDAYKQLKSKVDVVQTWQRYCTEREMGGKFVSNLAPAFAIDEVNYHRRDPNYQGPPNRFTVPIIRVQRGMAPLGSDYTASPLAANHGLKVVAEGGPEQKEALLNDIEKKISQGDKKYIGNLQDLTVAREPGNDRLIISHTYKNALGEDVVYRFFIEVEAKPAKN